MAVTYSLGKDAVLSGITGEIRTVTATVEGNPIDTTARGQTRRRYKLGMKDATIEVEVLNNPPGAGSDVEIAHPNSGLSGTFVVTTVVKAEPLEDVVTFNVTLKRKHGETSSPSS